MFKDISPCFIALGPAEDWGENSQGPRPVPGEVQAEKEEAWVVNLVEKLSSFLVCPITLQTQILKGLISHEPTVLQGC